MRKGNNGSPPTPRLDSCDRPRRHFESPLRLTSSVPKIDCMLDPTWVRERTRLVVLWAREPREHAPAQFVKAWSEGYEDAYYESFAAEKKRAEDDWREWPGEGSSWLFWTTHEEMARP